jgi:hypothetical protein
MYQDGQYVLPGAERRPAALWQQAADAPLRPLKAQQTCDHGLFSDDPTQVDLIDWLSFRNSCATKPRRFPQSQALE